MTRLTETALFTDDVRRGSAFYRRLLGADPIAEWPGGALFAVGEARLLVHERAPAVPGGPPNEDHFALAVDQLDDVCGALVADGFRFLVEPRDFPWGRSAYLRDPDGRLVELAQA